jgi:ATP-dependent helicase/nuclease subunit B
MQARFLIGPAGSGKTFFCLAGIREELLKSPDGPPLIFLAPKQATFQLERQLLADDSPRGYTRLHILSFERLAQFVLEELHVAPPRILSEEGRVMVLRALLIRRQGELKIFRASARLTGFAQQLSLLLREFQRHHLSPARLGELAARPDTTPRLRDKLHDLALLLREYGDWLKAQQLQDANHLLDVATDALRACPKSKVQSPKSKIEASSFFILHSSFSISALWLDGFAEMTPQELDLLAAVIPLCEHATLAFCLEREPQSAPSWLSTWAVVAQTFRRCHAKMAAVEGCEVSIETLANEPGKGRFVGNQDLQDLESNWSRPAQLSLTPGFSQVSDDGGAPVAVSTASISRKAAEAANDVRVPNIGLKSGANESGNAAAPPAIRLVKCANPENEAVLAAREILRHVRAGGRFRDCAVIVRDLEPYHAALNRVFRRYEIPIFMDRREPVSHHPLAELTRFAFRTVSFGWRHDDWFGALKTGLVPAREDEIDALENEALARGWEGNIWRAPLPRAENPNPAEGRVTRVPKSGPENPAQAGLVPPTENRFERLRKRLVPPFEKFANALAEKSFSPNGKQVTAALREFWNTLKVEETLEQWSQSTADHPSSVIRHSSIHSTVLDQMRDWLENVERAFSEESLHLRDWLPILEAGLANLTVGVIPPALDQVLVGAIDRSRNPDLKLAFVLGLNDGVFPAPPAPGILLTDAEREAMEERRVFLGPTPKQRIGHERYLGYIACTRASEKLVLTCALQDSEGRSLNPSPFFDHVKCITGVAEENFNGAAQWWESEHTCEIEAPVLRMQNEECRMKNGAELLQFSVFAPLLERWRQVRQVSSANHLAAEVVEKIFSRELKSSVSGLEDFAACPFKFFAARGLRLEERKEFQFDDRDKGSFQHDALREFHRRVTNSGRRWRDLNAAEAGELVVNTGRELLPVFGGGKFLTDGASRFTGGILIERLRRLVTALIEWMPQYEFDPTVCEIAFDDEREGELPSWRLDLGDGHALLLRGRIDRVDLCKLDGESALAVVMDYKSSVRKLDATKLHHGLELQLLSYLGVLRHLRSPEKIFGVKQLAPAGVFYVPLSGGGGKTGASRENVLTSGADERRAAYQHSGRFLADELAHFDNHNQSKGDQFKYSKNKGGEFSARGNDAMSAAEFEALREKVENHLRDYGRRIFDGEIAVSPFRIGRQTACDYCEFRAVCRFDPWTQPFRHLSPPPKQIKRTPVHTNKVE